MLVMPHTCAKHAYNFNASTRARAPTQSVSTAGATQGTLTHAPTVPRAVLTINMMCRHLFGFVVSATTRATGALAAFTGTAVAAGGISTACAFTGSACAIGGSAVVLYSGSGGAAMLVPVAPGIDESYAFVTRPEL